MLSLPFISMCLAEFTLLFTANVFRIIGRKTINCYAITFFRLVVSLPTPSSTRSTMYVSYKCVHMRNLRSQTSKMFHNHRMMTIFPQCIFQNQPLQNHSATPSRSSTNDKDVDTEDPGNSLFESDRIAAEFFSDDNEISRTVEIFDFCFFYAETRASA